MERWLPRGFQIDKELTVGKQLSSGTAWQLYSTSSNGYAVAISPSLYDKWCALDIVPSGLFERKTSSDREVYIAFDKHDNRIASVKYGPYPESYEDAVAFAAALKRSRSAFLNDSFEDALYFERYSLILPTYGAEEMDDQTVLCRWIASGVEISLDRFDRLCEIVSWMSPSALADVMRQAGFSVSEDAALAIEKSRTKEASEERAVTVRRANLPHEIGEHFSLPGRPALESFFNEHVVDIIRNSEKYKRMGIGFPSAVILHGPPGCGKTFAVEKLIEFLGWPSFNIDSGSIGSPFIHDTSKKISEVFAKAIDNAPSVLVIDEMEAFLSSRELSQGSGQHHVEEVAEFLRKIPEAAGKNVLVIAMTNLIDTIDPAILRRGRFDHIIEVQMPSKEEVESLLHHLFRDLPVSDDIDYDGIASQLKGHAMSDVTYVVKEAGRLAVKGNQDAITNSLLCAAIDSLPKKKENMRKIGF
jgi:hypothetical protein